MDQMTEMTGRDIKKILMSLIFIFAIVIILGVLYFLYNSGNSKEAISAGMNTISFVISGASFFISTIAVLLTYESLKITREGLKITQKTLKKTEIEQQIRDIEQRLDFFYYPMSNYFEIARGKQTKGGLNDDDRRDRIRAYSYRYQAQKRTREQIEKLYEVDKDTTDKAEIKETLKKYIENDIKEYEKQIQKFKEDSQTLTNEKEIDLIQENSKLNLKLLPESTEKKKKWYEFWK